MFATVGSVLSLLATGARAQEVESRCPASVQTKLPASWPSCIVAVIAPGIAMPETAKPAPFERPGADVIRRETASILTDPHFAPRQTFWQWLVWKLRAWDKPGSITLPPGLREFLAWMVVVWCVITLLAILGHLVWTLAGLLRGGARSPILALRRGAAADTHRSREELLLEIQHLAQHGKFREAIGLLMVVVLRSLDEIGVVRFHESKTNGDYLREYNAACPGREEFRQLVLTFDTTIYGGQLHGLETYKQMCVLWEDMHSRVHANA